MEDDIKNAGQPEEVVDDATEQETSVQAVTDEDAPVGDSDGSPADTAEIPVLEPQRQETDEVAEKQKKKKRVIIIILIVIAALIVLAAYFALITYIMIKAIVTTGTVIIKSVTEEIVTGVIDEFVNSLGNL